MNEGLRVHERYFKERTAGLELSGLYLEWRGRCDLTHLECLRILNGIVADEIKFALRSERHPDDPDKKADEA